MSKEQHESLNEGDLHQNVAEPNRHKIEQGEWGWRPARVLSNKGRIKKEQHCDHRNHKNAAVRPILPDSPSSRSRVAALGREDLICLEGEEEERRVVAHRRHVVRILTRKAMRIVACNQIRKRVAARAADGAIQNLQAGVVH